MNLRTIQLNILPEFMISFHEPDPDIPGLAPIVNSGGGDILRFLLAVNSEWVVIKESRIADWRLQSGGQSDQRLSYLQHQEQF